MAATLGAMPPWLAPEAEFGEPVTPGAPPGASVEAPQESQNFTPSANWEPHFELGGELDSASQLDAARNEFGEAARLNPNNARTHFNYGVLLAKQNRRDEAQREFEETIRLEPTYMKAREYLAQLQARKRRTP